ncbi:hypothetical protein QWZ04_06585 [Vibrio tapetis subsp. quintayensis]|uniref:hypothetical protein n=1 Tax=Vibrio tapetis TaxID=52443 RepID=UPI0025B550E2|nr:hypothetical protein [Vibrio tapetis]MDN3679994.1 hypothetical protein [Vibrio tapetis subsp. quintayensis]
MDRTKLKHRQQNALGNEATFANAKHFALPKLAEDTSDEADNRMRRLPFDGRVQAQKKPRK